MRNLAASVITATAVACGLPEASVFPELEAPKKEEIFLPEQRLEMAWLDEQLIYQGWRVARVPADDEAVCRTRYAIYRATLPVRVLVRWTEQAALDLFCREFLRLLPGKVRDSAGNPVRITASRASRKGYTFATIRIEEKPTQALHLHFTGIIHKDVDTDWITSVTLHPRYEV